MRDAQNPARSYEGSGSWWDERVEPFADVLAANADFSRDFRHGEVPGRAVRGLAVVTCMDPRIPVPAMLGLRPGDATVLRNAGARVTDEVLRTLVLAAYALDVTRVLVVAHTDCRMSAVSDADVHADTLARGVDTRSLEFGTVADQAGTLAADVQRIRSWPFLPASLVAAGCVYDVATGRVSVTVPAE